MTIAVLEGLAPEWFTPIQDGEDKDKTQFKIKPLDGMTYADVLLECKTDGKGNVQLSTEAKNICIKNGLIDWKNRCDSEGKQIEFSKKEIPKLPGKTIIAIATEIFCISALAGEAEKN